MDEARVRRKTMPEKVLIALLDVAKKAGITPAQAKYWVKLLGIILVMRGRTGFLEVADADNLGRMADLVAEGATPKDAALKIGGIVQEKDIIPGEVSGHAGVGELKAKLDRMEQRNEMIEKALLMLVEENRAIRKELGKLVETNQALRITLEAPPIPAVLLAPPKPVQAWQPLKDSTDPLEGAGFFERIWVWLIHPERLRRGVEN